MTTRRACLSLAWCLPAALLAAFVAPPGRADNTDPEPGATYPKTLALHRGASANNLKQIGLAFHNFHDAMGRLPAAAIRDGKGKALLSWRVALLPYLEEDKLYREFKLDEPWDSKHNKKLLARMPKVYAPTVQGKPARANHTYYRVFTGAGTLFDPRQARGQGIGTLGATFAQVTDGTSNTVLVIEAGDPVLWTRPDELEYDAKKKLPKIGGLFKEGYNVLFADGSVVRLSRKLPPADLRKLITPSGGEVVDRNRLPAPEEKK